MKTGKLVTSRKRFPNSRKERGASSLEYIMLAGVLVGILAILATTGLDEKVSGFFTSIFNFATSQVPSGSSGG